jgi:hypothetical protein
MGQSILNDIKFWHPQIGKKYPDWVFKDYCIQPKVEEICKNICEWLDGSIQKTL